VRRSGLWLRIFVVGWEPWVGVAVGVARQIVGRWLSELECPHVILGLGYFGFRELVFVRQSSCDLDESMSYVEI